jgi:ketosteroid isomerase-like protein
MCARKSFAAILAALAISCTGEPSRTCGAVGTAGAVMRDIVAADDSRDIERVMTDYTDDAVWVQTPPAPSLHSSREIRQNYRRMYGAFNPSLSIVVDAAEARKDAVIVTGRTTGTLSPQMTEVPARQVDDRFEATLRCDRGRWRVARMVSASAH